MEKWNTKKAMSSLVYLYLDWGQHLFVQVAILQYKKLQMQLFTRMSILML